MPFPTYHTYTNIPGIPTGAGFKPHNSASLWVFDNPISATTTAGIYDTAEYNLNTFQVNANITSQTKSGIDLVGAQNTVKIGQNREVDGTEYAVQMTGDHSELINNGTLHGSSRSVWLKGGSYAGFVNNGIVNKACYLSGKQVVVHLSTSSWLKDILWIASVVGDSAVIVNEGNIVGPSTSSGFTNNAITGQVGHDTFTNTATGTINGEIDLENGNNTFINQGGTLTGQLQLGNDVDTVVNSGKIDGDVRLGRGDDLFDNRGGTVTGEVQGGMGDDTYVVDAGAVKMIENTGAGVDTVKSTVAFSLSATPYASQELENLTLIGDSAVYGTGNGLANILTGNGAANLLQGLDGHDTLDGGVGNDFLDGGTGLDKLVGGGGNDKLQGGAEADTLSGNDGLTGGTGRDIFMFDAKPNAKSNLDRIGDFNVRDDSLWLDNAVFKKLGKGTELKPGKLNAKFFTIGDKAKDANDYLVYNGKTGVLSYDADGSGAKAAVAVAMLKKGLKMTYADVFVI